MSSAKKNRSQSFEQSISRLEEIITRMDDPQTGLEEMLALVEEGLELHRRSKDILSAAELRIKALENPTLSAPAAQQQPQESQNNDFSLL